MHAKVVRASRAVLSLGGRARVNRLRLPGATTMKKLSVVTSFAILVAVCATAQIFRTNKIGRSDAVRIASRLSAGMAEWSAYRFMETNGLTFGYTVGGTVSRTRFYLLSDGCELDLEFSTERGTWTNQVLAAASVRSNNVKFESITLTNRL